jgi:drug/metabolite transporter superfamily protein YnfA
MAERSGDTTSIGWLRALASAVVILVAGAVLFVFAPNWLLTHLTGLSRNGRVAVVATAFVVVFVAFAWVLRRLQARRVI